MTQILTIKKSWHLFKSKTYLNVGIITSFLSIVRTPLENKSFPSFVCALHFNPFLRSSTFWTDKDFIKFTFNVRGNNWKQTCCIPFCTHFTAFHSVIVSRNQSSEWMSDNHKVVIVIRNKLKFFRWLWCHPVHCFVWKIFFNVNTFIF